MRSNRTSCSGFKAGHGFSLTELVAILAVLSLASFLMVPALARTRTNGRAIGCLNNLRQVMEAWTMYAEEHNGQVANNFGITGTQTTISDKSYQNWATDVVDWHSDNTNLALIIRVGQLSSYLKGNSNVFKCPADDYLSPLQRSAGYARARSISMNSVLGRFSAGNDSTAQGLNLFSPGFAQHLYLGRIPKPARTWVVLDEHPDSINDGIFLSIPPPFDGRISLPLTTPAAVASRLLIVIARFTNGSA